ncbi:MAG: cytochrome c [Planctomycetes bacterium]|nr:cytochrome c [Planctomycetota bacterium]
MRLNPYLIVIATVAVLGTTFLASCQEVEIYVYEKDEYSDFGDLRGLMANVRECTANLKNDYLTHDWRSYRDNAKYLVQITQEIKYYQKPLTYGYTKNDEHTYEAWDRYQERAYTSALKIERDASYRSLGKFKANLEEMARTCNACHEMMDENFRFDPNPNVG